MGNQKAAEQSRQRIADWESYQSSIEAVQTERDFFKLRKAYNEISPKGADKAFFENFEKAYQNKYYTFTMPNQRAAILIENFVKKYPVQPKIEPYTGSFTDEETDDKIMYELSGNKAPYQNGEISRWTGQMVPHFKRGGKLRWISEILSDDDEFHNKQEYPVPVGSKVVIIYDVEKEDKELQEVSRLVGFFDMMEDALQIEPSGLRGLLSIPQELRESYQNVQMQESDWLKVEAERRNLRLQIIIRNLDDSKEKAAQGEKITNLKDYFWDKYRNVAQGFVNDLAESATGRALSKTANERIATGITDNEDLKSYLESSLYNYGKKQGGEEFWKLAQTPEIFEQLLTKFYGKTLRFGGAAPEITDEERAVAENFAEVLAVDENFLATGEDNKKIVVEDFLKKKLMKIFQTNIELYNKYFANNEAFKNQFVELVLGMAQEKLEARTLEQVIEQYGLNPNKTKVFVEESFEFEKDGRMEFHVLKLLKKQPSVLLRKSIEKAIWQALKPFLYKQGEGNVLYPTTHNNQTLRALYDVFIKQINLRETKKHSLGLVEAVLKSRKDDWRNNKYKQKAVKDALTEYLKNNNLPLTLAEEAYDIIFKYNDY